MSQTVKDIDGSIHSFPDDATPEEINSAFSQIDKERKFDALKQAVGVKPGLMANFTGGLLNTATGLAKNIVEKSNLPAQALNAASKLIPGMQGMSPLSPIENALNKFDPYKAMGTTDQPISTLAGLEQAAGGLFMPGKAATAVYNPAKAVGKKLIDMVSPVKASNSLLQDLGKESANTQDATASIASATKKAHDARAEEAGMFFNHPLQQAGNEKIYEHVNPLITTKMDKAKSLMDSVKDLNVGDLFERFKSNPTFQNAHNLQSELGVMMGDIQKIPARTIAEKLQLADLKSVRDTLKGHIADFLTKRDLNSNENLAPAYKKGSDLWQENVVPYLANTKLRQIVREGRTSVPNIHKIFESPYDISAKDGTTKIGPINKILQDLPDDTKDQILFRKIGAYKNVNDPASVVKEIKNADQGGYSHLLSQDTKNKLLDINNKSKNLSRLKYGTGVAGLAGAEELIRKFLIK